jgi:hypothetical protein
MAIFTAINDQPMNNKGHTPSIIFLTGRPEHRPRTALGEFSMYTPKHIAEAMAELFDDPKWEGGMGATTIAWCNLWDRVASETGLSEEALMQLMKEGFLLRMEQKRQMGKVMRLLTAKPGDRGGICRAGRQGGIQ